MKKIKAETEFINVFGRLAMKQFSRNAIKRILKSQRHTKAERRNVKSQVPPLYHIGAFTPEQIKSGRLFYRGRHKGDAKKIKSFVKKQVGDAFTRYCGQNIGAVS